MNKYFFFLIFIWCFNNTLFAQHIQQIDAHIVSASNTVLVKQKLQYKNKTAAPIHHILLGDWNNSYANNNTPLGKRFSDEFVRSFHLIPHSERGKTVLQHISSAQKTLDYCYLEQKEDILEILLQTPLLPGQEITLDLAYTLQLPDAKYTGHGKYKNGVIQLKHAFLFPTSIHTGDFENDSNENLEDYKFDASNIQLKLTTDAPFDVTSNMEVQQLDAYQSELTASNFVHYDLYLEPKSTFTNYKINRQEIQTNIVDKKTTEAEKLIAINRIATFVRDYLQTAPLKKIVVSQQDYEKSPFYGINQLPHFISPFEDDFIFELKFLKTYLTKTLKEQIQNHDRKEAWIQDSFQTYVMMEYLETFYPKLKLMGKISNYKILKGFEFAQANFNDQFYYVYLLMCRRNLDQSLNTSKDGQIKFNEQIATRYKGGLNFQMLAAYMGKSNLQNGLRAFIKLNENQQTNALDFYQILQNQTTKDLGFYKNELVESNRLIDFKIKKIYSTTDSTYVVLKNKTDAFIPVPIYGVRRDTIQFKTWIPPFVKDTLLAFSGTDYSKFVVNYEGDVPEIYRANNWKSVGKFKFNKPVKVTIFRDIEDPNTNQLFLLPQFSYNYYDGFSPGISINNKSVFAKPFTYDITPTLSWNTKELIGNASLSYNQMVRNKRLYNIRYNIFGHTYHYAPEAIYYKISPSVIFSFRDPDLRKNNSENVILRYVVLDREKSAYVDVSDRNYAVFNLRYTKGENEISRLYSYSGDLQLANKFGKVAANTHYRKLFDNSRQLSLRFFGGLFLYHRTTTDFFDFSVDKPTDYLYDYGILGRSESTGLYSQQFIMAEGAFKSRYKDNMANQWMATVNGSYSIWNWVEVYGDLGWKKNRTNKADFLYDSGIRLNLVQDYFELYFPVYSNNGWEIAQPNYQERVRFIFTFSPKTLVSLFTRKWL